MILLAFLYIGISFDCGMVSTVRVYPSNLFANGVQPFKLFCDVVFLCHFFIPKKNKWQCACTQKCVGSSQPSKFFLLFFSIVKDYFSSAVVCLRWMAATAYAESFSLVQSLLDVYVKVGVLLCPPFFVKRDSKQWGLALLLNVLFNYFCRYVVLPTWAEMGGIKKK